MNPLAVPSPRWSAPSLLALSSDGRLALHVHEGALRLESGARTGSTDPVAARALMPSEHVVAAALVKGSAWLIVHARTGHWLYRFDPDGAAVEPALSLGELGESVAMSVTREGVALALIEGVRAVLVQEHGASVEVTDLGPAAADRRVLLAGRGVVERQGRQLLFRRSSAIAPLVLPPELDGAVLCSGGLVLDGTAAVLELEEAGKRTLLMLEPHGGGVRGKFRLGEAAVLAIAERKGLVVLGRGTHLALLDLRSGRCVGERLLGKPARAAAIDANGTT